MDPSTPTNRRQQSQDGSDGLSMPASSKEGHSQGKGHSQEHATPSSGGMDHFHSVFFIYILTCIRQQETKEAIFCTKATQFC
jgi:hypothetical protein